MTRVAHIQPYTTGGRSPEGRAVVPEVAWGAVGWKVPTTGNRLFHSALNTPSPVRGGLGRGIFGETAVSQKLSWWSTPYQFTGKEKDDETGYNYFGARYYNSDISIWLSVDPMADKFPSITAYAYCYNKPIDHIDRFGLWGEEKAKRKHAQAIEKYGVNRVSEIRWRENGKKKDYGFRVYNSAKEKEMDGQRTGNMICGTQVWDLGTKMYSNNDLRQYVQPLPGNAAGSDFYLTYAEAKYNYKHGNGRPAYVYLNKLNLGKIHANDFNHKETYQGYPTLIVNLLGEHMANAEEGAVYGRITLVLIGEKTVMALEDTYDFDIKGTPNRFIRDFATMYKKSQTGPGVPYSIIFMGTTEIQN